MHTPVPLRLPEPGAVARWLAGESPPDEAAIVRAWVEADGYRRQTAQGLKTLGDAEWHPDVDRMWSRLECALASEDGLVPRSPIGRAGDVSRQFAKVQAEVPVRPGQMHEKSMRTASSAHRWQGGAGLGKRTLQMRMWYAAAGLMIGVLGLVIGRSGLMHQIAGAGPKAMVTYATANGERANIKLPDGSTVALNVASRLDVPVDYAAGNHAVRLIGEALFTVPRHVGMPFTVTAGVTTARVLGTSFVVRHYATDTTVTVAVRDGKVAVGDRVITGAQLLEIRPHGSSQLRLADASQYDFTVGVLKLTGMPLSQAIPELDRWYAADIRLGDSSFAQVPIKGEFPAGSLSNLAEYLETILDARVVRDGRIITLHQKMK